MGAIAIGDLVKTTLGPKGMDKILQSTGREGNITVTNDGATILKSIRIDNPAAKILIGKYFFQYIYIYFKKKFLKHKMMKLEMVQLVLLYLLLNY